MARVDNKLEPLRRRLKYNDDDDSLPYLDCVSVEDLKAMFLYIDAVEDHIFGHGDYRKTFEAFMAARQALGMKED